MRIVVDRNLCDSQGQCAAAVPDLFDLGDDDVLHVLDEQPPEDRRGDVEVAVARCPKRALGIEG
jgi:ferredoxin